jgi:hypothetical protein
MMGENLHGLMNPLTKAKWYVLLISNYKSSSSSRPSDYGISQQRNSCFAAAAIRLLISSRSFSEMNSSGVENCEVREEVIRLSIESKTRTVSLEKLRALLGGVDNGDYDNGQQQDGVSFLVCLLRYFPQLANELRVSNTSGCCMSSVCINY